MGASSALRVYDALKSHLGDEDARLFIEYIETTVRDVRGDLATKADLADLRTATKADVAELRVATKADVAELRADLQKQVAETRADLIRWMFLFWIGQVAVLFGLMELVLAPG